MMRTIIQTDTVAVISAVLVGVSLLISTSITTTADGQAFVDQGTAKVHLGEAIKALQSGDNAAAEGYMKEADKTIPEGTAKMHLGEAIKALQSGDIDGAEMHAQAAAQADME